MKITFRRFGFAFDDCSHPHPTSTSSDNGSRLPLTKLFSATSECFGHKINKSSRFLSVLQVVRFPSELSRIGYIFTLSADSLRPYSNWRTTETSEQYRSGNELIRRCSSLPQPVASQIRRASRGKMKRVLCAAVFSCASIETRYPAIDGKQSLKIDALSFPVVAAEQSCKPMGPEELRNYQPPQVDYQFDTLTGWTICPVVAKW